MIHPVKRGLNDYKYSADPILEVLYFTSVSKKILFSGGIFAQVGEHNWKQLYGHTFYDDYGMSYRFRTDFDRQLQFLSLGIPIKFEIETKSIIFNSFILGFTAGNYLKLEMADFYKSVFVASFPVFNYYKSLFWEINLGFRKNLYTDRFFSVSLSPVAGYRNESSIKEIGYYNYLFYGVGISVRLRR